MDKLYSIRDCGKLIGVAPHKIAYAHTQDRIPEPKLRVANKRVYTLDDCRRVARYFGVEIRQDKEMLGGK
jgi:DNA-binding transcriptional MerR regulator